MNILSNNKKIYSSVPFKCHFLERHMSVCARKLLYENEFRKKKFVLLSLLYNDINFNHNKNYNVLLRIIIIIIIICIMWYVSCVPFLYFVKYPNSLNSYNTKRRWKVFSSTSLHLYEEIKIPIKYSYMKEIFSTRRKSCGTV